MAITAAMSASVSCACSNSKEEAAEEVSQPEFHCDTPTCAACDSTYYCEE